MNSRQEPDGFDAAAAAIEEVAADWLGRRDAGLSRAEEQRFQDWLASDVRHVSAYARLEQASKALDQLAVYQWSKDAQDDPDLEEAFAPASANRSWWRVGGVALAAAAIVMLGAFVGSIRHNSEALAANHFLATDVGALRAESLADGSQLNLNTDSAAEVVYSPEERRVTLLRGEAHFTVEKDAARPFVVQAGNVRIRAVGTAFNVRLHGDGVEVLVTEGRVRLEDSQRGKSLLAERDGGESVLTLGQHAVVRMAPDSANERPQVALGTLATEEIARRLAWQEQRIEFGPTSLHVVAAEFNRHNRHQLRIADEATGQISVGGTFRANDPETFVRLLETTFDVVAERRGTETILRQQR